MQVGVTGACMAAWELYLQKRMCSPVPLWSPTTTTHLPTPPPPHWRPLRHVPQARLYVVSATGDHNLPHPAPPVPDTHVSEDEVETILPNGSLTHMSARMSLCVHGRCLTFHWQDTPRGNDGTGWKGSAGVSPHSDQRALASSQAKRQVVQIFHLGV